MGNIFVGIKRFLKNKNTVTIIAVLASIGILYWAYYYRIQEEIKPVSVPYATRTIGPRTLITNDMVSFKKASRSMIRNNVIVSSKSIIGKYSSNKVVIPEGSMFYTSTILDLENLPSSLFEDIPPENTVVYLDVDLNSTYGNSIYPGNAIDIYFRDGKLLGRFISSIKVLAVVDGSGNNVFETVDNPKQPASLMFSVPDDIYVLIKKAVTKGYELFPVPRDKYYTQNAKTTAVASAQIEDHINKGTVSYKESNSSKGGAQ